MKKLLKVLLILCCLGALGFVVYKLYQNDKVKEKLFSGLHEDLVLAIESKIRLAIDVLCWPIHFVKALLP